MTRFLAGLRKKPLIERLESETGMEIFVRKDASERCREMRYGWGGLAVL